MMTAIWTLVAWGLLLTPPPTDAPLPPALLADMSFEPAGRFRVDAGPDATCEVVIHYNNIGDDKNVTLHWATRHGQAAKKHHVMKVPVSFRPVSVVPRAGTSNTLYVAGWIERSGGKLVLETWRIHPPEVIAEAMNQSTGQLITTSLDPTVVRGEPIDVAGVGPIWGMACNPYGSSDRLYLLEHTTPGSPVSVWEYDTATEALVDQDADGTPDAVASSTTSTALSTAKSLRVGSIPGLGLMVYATATPLWSHAYNNAVWAVMIDTQRTGTVDLVSQVDTEVFLQSHPYAVWDQHFSP